MRPVILLTGMIVILATSALAQIPDTFTNLQILDSSIQKERLVSLMRNMSSALGVKCDFCHVQRADQQGTDFASDSSEHKRIARDMMRMTHAINADYIAKMNPDSTSRVNVMCATCHRGSPKPQFITDVLKHAVAAGGPDSAITLYMSLREKFYGRAVYDFGAPPLSDFAMQLFNDSDHSDAIQLQKLNVELNPKSADALFTLAQMYFETTDSTLGMQALDSSLALDPKHRRAAELKKSLSEAK